MKPARKVDLEIIRIVAVLLIIFNHTDGYIFYTETSNILTWIFSVGMACICRAGVPLFFMVSGALLLSKDETIKELLCKRGVRILTVLFVASVFYYIFDVFRYKMPDAGIKDFWVKLCACDIRESLWFLYAYFMILLTLPFFRIMVKYAEQKLIQYLFGLKVIFSFIIPLLRILFDFPLFLDAGFVDDYIFYMILGYYMETHNICKEKKKTIYAELACFVGCIAADMAIMRIYFLNTGGYTQEISELFICVMTPIVFRMCQKISEKFEKNDIMRRMIVYAGQCVFGIYLLDNFVRWQLLPLYLFLCEKTIGVFACSVYVSGTFILGFIYTAILRKIPFMKKYL